MDPHTVTLTLKPGGTDQKLLFRIPIGVRVFKVNVGSAFFLYYETSESHNIIPTHYPMGTYSGQVMQEVVLIVSPVPLRDPNLATDDLSFNEITLDELNKRRAQEGDPPISADGTYLRAPRRK